ncbi:MAG: PHP domain-containing protein, partial [Dehalococcoidales bacterium]|nr:PHP domain-containing protein [Dehalococcoidales bacterium]
EGGEEIERAARGTVPRLLEPSHIKGDLHIHSDWSDGRDTIEAMVLAAKALGYEYVGISDHSGGRGIARGLNRARLKEQMAEIKALNERMGGVRILTGLEVDIRSDGTLDMPDEVLKELDIVTASIHSGMNQTQEQITRRIVKAMENPNVDVLGHPTGRLMPEREPFAVDMEAIFQAAAKNKTILEINAMPSRLDLKDTHVYRARELGLMLVISTDAHSTEHLGFMRFGVGVARRGWCEAKDILNTKPLAELLKYLKSRGKK